MTATEPAAPSPPSSPIPSPTAGRMITMPWPTIPPEVLPHVDLVNRRLDEIRGNPKKSGTWEQSLFTRIHELIDSEVLVRPDAFEFTPEDAGRLAHEPETRAFFEWCCMVRASFLWPLSLLIYGSDVEEIRRISGLWMVEGKEGGLCAVTGKAPDAFNAGAGRDEDALLINWFRQLLGQPGLTGRLSLSEDSPMAEAVVPTAKGPIRIAAATSPVVTGSSRIAVTIRVPRTTGPQSLQDFVAAGTMTTGVSRFLKASVRARLNLLLTGDTGTGKTTLMRALAAEIPEVEPIIVIEDNPELYLDQARRNGKPYHRLVIPLGTAAGRMIGDKAITTMSDLAAHALRHRGSRILLGEARGAEMVDVLSAMTSGSDGSMVTIHARRAEDGPDRAALLASFSPTFRGNPKAAMALVNQAVYLCIHLGYVNTPTGRRRIVDGVVAYDSNGDAVAVYSVTDLGEIERNVETLAELPPRVAQPLSKWIREVPPAG